MDHRPSFAARMPTTVATRRDAALSAALSEDIQLFAERRRFAVHQYLAAVDGCDDADDLAILHGAFAATAARDYARQALFFQTMLDELCAIDGETAR